MLSYKLGARVVSFWDEDKQRVAGELGYTRGWLKVNFYIISEIDPEYVDAIEALLPKIKGEICRLERAM